MGVNTAIFTSSGQWPCPHTYSRGLLCKDQDPSISFIMSMAFLDINWITMSKHCEAVLAPNVETFNGADSVACISRLSPNVQLEWYISNAWARCAGTSAGVGFAIPMSTVARLVPQLIQFGKAVRPALNVQVRIWCLPAHSSEGNSGSSLRAPVRCSLPYYVCTAARPETRT